MKKKGFTLIELLAVIVILAIIALIATPMILNVVEESKRKSAELSAYGYVEAVENQIAFNELNTDKTKIEDGTPNISTLTDVKVKGEKPTAGWVKIEKRQVVAYSLKIGEYVINYDGTETKTTKGGEAAPNPDGDVVKQGPTKEEANSTSTHRGIVYLDPTDLSKTCNESNSISTSETKTGCMKWYIYNDDGDNYTMILDHNTTAKILWNDSKNVSYEESNLYAVVEDLKTTSGWVVNPRIISAEEIAKITGKTDFDPTKANSYYYLDSNDHTKTATTKGTSKYAWLFDYTDDCTNFGCNIADLSTEGYWTSTIVGTAGSGFHVWYVDFISTLGINDVYLSDGGIRPVITISKSIIG